MYHFNEIFICTIIIVTAGYHSSHNFTALCNCQILFSISRLIIRFLFIQFLIVFPFI